jgi:multicomponent Na+:H+ antiporter subunit E
MFDGGKWVFRIKAILQTLGAVAFLMGIWIVLTGNYTVFNIIAGAAIGSLSLYLAHRFIKMRRITGIKLIRLLLYPFFLIARIYISSINVIKTIFKGGEAQVISLETDVTNEFLMTALSSSINLTPGSVLLDQEDSKLTILWLKGKKHEVSDINEEVKGPLERKLLKIQRK